MTSNRILRTLAACVLLSGLGTSAAADGTEENDDLIEVTIGTVTTMMAHEELLKSGLVPLITPTPAQSEMERLILSGAFSEVPKPYPHGAANLDSKAVFDWPGGIKYTREQLKAKLDQAVKDLAENNSGRRESAATFLTAAWQYGRIRYEPSIKPLREALNDGNLSVRREAAFALAYLGEMGSARAELVAQCYFSRLAALGASKVLDEIMRRTEFSFPCRAQTLHYLNEFQKGKRAQDIRLRMVREGLKASASEYEREYYVGALGKIRGSAAMAMIRKLAESDPSAGVRKMAQDELKKLGARSGGSR